MHGPHLRLPRARIALALPIALATPAFAQAEAAQRGLWSLFMQSLDIFTLVLVVGSLYAVGLIVRCVLDLRQSAIAPQTLAKNLLDHADRRDRQAVRRLAGDDESMLGRVVAAGVELDGGQRREAAEAVAGMELARWFGRIEPLSVVGNLGPLIGLAGTVWGMILAFTSLGAAGGQADPSALSEGISKALFHTLLGLVLAIPCLAVHGWYRARLDRWCSVALADATRVLDRLDADGRAQPSQQPGQQQASREPRA